jgi:hypothetical protein
MTYVDGALLGDSSGMLGLCKSRESYVSCMSDQMAPAMTSCNSVTGDHMTGVFHDIRSSAI